MSLGSISKCVPQPFPKSSNFLDVLWLFPTGQALANLWLCCYGCIRILAAFSDLTHVSWELLFRGQIVDTSLTTPQAGSQPPWPPELPCAPCSSDQLTWSAVCSSKPQPCQASYLAATEADAASSHTFIQLLLRCWWKCPWCFSLLTLWTCMTP